MKSSIKANLAIYLSTLATRACTQNISSSSDGLPFDPREATIASTHNALYTGQTTCVAIVSSFLSRIESLNHPINAIISLDPTALTVAASLDALLASQTATPGPLFCIPTLLKDNFDTTTSPTTAGNLLLSDSRPTRDAPTVAALRAAGAVVLGKTNLHELALEGISVSSVGGQTVNPYDFSRTPGGSSGGTGAAVAASFAVWGTGSDTVNSLRSPASANALVSVRPTWGLVSRVGVVPNSYTQDVVGPIGRCVEDVAVALGVMAGVGYDEGDNATEIVPVGVRGTDYRESVEGGALEGLRIGVLEGLFNRTATNETEPVNEAMEEMMSKLGGRGVSFVNITQSIYNATDMLVKYDTQQYEYREEINAYLQRPELGGNHPNTLDEIFNSSGKFVVLPSQYDYVKTALVSSTGNATWESRPSYATVKQGVQSLTLALQETFVRDKLDAIIYPEQKNLVVKIGSPSQSGRNGILAALTGSPVVTVPAGFSAPSSDAPVGVPIGMEILGQPWTEAKLLQIAYQVQELTRVRRMPDWAKQVVPIKSYTAVPSVTPNIENIPAAYPLGTLGRL